LTTEGSTDNNGAPGYSLALNVSFATAHFATMILANTSSELPTVRRS